MTRINSIRQLQEAKRKLNDRRHLAEQNINAKWSALKTSVKPANLARETLGSVFSTRKGESGTARSVAMGLVSLGAGIVLRKFVSRALKRVLGH